MKIEVSAGWANTPDEFTTASFDTWHEALSLENEPRVFDSAAGRWHTGNARVLWHEWDETFAANWHEARMIYQSGQSIISYMEADEERRAEMLADCYDLSDQVTPKLFREAVDFPALQQRIAWKLIHELRDNPEVLKVYVELGRLLDTETR